jgi:hypothetical protein
MPEPTPPVGPAVVSTESPAADAATEYTPESDYTPPNALLEVMSAFLVPLALTLLIEVPIVAIAGRGSKQAWKVGFLVNTATNPVAVLTSLVLSVVLWRQSAFAPLLAVAAVEAAVVVVEWRIFRWTLGWSNRRAITTSLIANAASFGIGLAILWRGLFGF